MSTDTGLSFETEAFLHSNFKRLIIEKFYDIVIYRNRSTVSILFKETQNKFMF